MNKLDLDRGDSSNVLPTLRNKNIFNKLMKELGVEKLMDTYKKDYLSYTKAVMFDPRNSNVVYRTEEQAKKAQEYAQMVDELDKEYLEKNP